MKMQKVRSIWNISVGVRKKDKERMELIQAALDRNKDKIMKILDDYGIPHVPVVEGDSIQKVYRKVMHKVKMLVTEQIKKSKMMRLFESSRNFKSSVNQIIN